MNILQLEIESINVVQDDFFTFVIVQNYMIWRYVNL